MFGMPFGPSLGFYLRPQPGSSQFPREPLQGKENFEALARDFGVIISEYLSDNATAFTSAEYREHLSKFAQVSQYAGVGAHHHNGIAERSIQTVMSIARTMSSLFTSDCRVRITGLNTRTCTRTIFSIILFRTVDNVSCFIFSQIAVVPAPCPLKPTAPHHDHAT